MYNRNLLTCPSCGDDSFSPDYGKCLMCCVRDTKQLLEKRAEDESRDCKCTTILSKRKSSTKRSREQKHRNRIKELSKYGYHRVFRQKDWFDPESRIVKRSYGCGGVRFYKNYCNRKLRRFKGEVKNGGHYKKLNEFWWVID